MASSKHDFIVASLSRRIRQFGYKIIYLDGKKFNITSSTLHIPPRIINHRPDIIGDLAGVSFCIGEAKTESDILSLRTKNQLLDFYSLIKTNSSNMLFFGIPLKSKESFRNLLMQHELQNAKQIDILYIPEELFPDEEEI